MPDNTLSYRDLVYVVETEKSLERAWRVFVDGKVVLTGQARRTLKSSAFRTAVHQAQAAIDAMQDEEQAA